MTASRSVGRLRGQWNSRTVGWPFCSCALTKSTCLRDSCGTELSTLTKQIPPMSRALQSGSPFLQRLQRRQSRQPYLGVNRLVGIVYVVIATRVDGRHTQLCDLPDDELDGGW